MKSHLQNVFLVIFGVVLALVISDKILAIYLDSVESLKLSERSIILREYSPSSELFLFPSEHEQRQADNLLVEEYEFLTDKDGFITVSEPTDQRKGKVDIIFLGGSTTANLFVEQYNRFPFQVSSLLLNGEGKKIRTLNAGVSGNHTLHSVLSFISKGIKYKPKIAVLMHNINDISLLSRTGSYWVNPPTREIVKGKSIEDYLPLWKRLSRGVKNLLFPNLYKLYLKKFLPIVYIDEWLYTEQRNVDKKEIIDSFEKALLTFIYICKSWDIEPVLMTQMSRLDKNDLAIVDFYSNSQPPPPLSFREFTEIHHSLNEKIKVVSDQEGILHIDLDKQLSGKKMYLYDAVHLTEEGSNKAAELIAESLAEKYPKHFYLKDD
jgi:hypothetical protein